MFEIGDIWISCIICTVSVLIYLMTFQDKNMRLFLPISGPSVFYFIGKKTHQHSKNDIETQSVSDVFISLLPCIVVSLGLVILIIISKNIARRRRSVSMHSDPIVAAPSGLPMDPELYRYTIPEQNIIHAPNTTQEVISRFEPNLSDAPVILHGLILPEFYSSRPETPLNDPAPPHAEAHPSAPEMNS